MTVTGNIVPGAPDDRERLERELLNRVRPAANIVSEPDLIHIASLRRDIYTAIRDLSEARGSLYCSQCGKYL